ncbi:hypothetical protein [Phaffia rhodozyma]|uniref:F-box domain-containing protein n=1 Tax=Phaffia rhodozyma TaxID=264483 RepID=A0A0F7SSX8_PHARH|nr:hypothetical protein [Phaffia rhodozyma]
MEETSSRLSSLTVAEQGVEPRRLPCLPAEIWRKIIIHASPGRVFDCGLTNSIEEQEGSLSGLGFWRVNIPSQHTRYNICLVSRQFRDLCTPLLYRDLKLSSPNSIPLFARTIFRNPITDPWTLEQSTGWKLPNYASYAMRLDVDLSRWLNKTDAEGNPIWPEDQEDAESDDEDEEWEEDHPMELISRLIWKLDGLRMFLWDSTENLHSLPNSILHSLARAPCSQNLKDLDWFPVSRKNFDGFCELLMSAKGIQHLEIGELHDHFFMPTTKQIVLPDLHTLAISGDGLVTSILFSQASLPSLKRLTHWSTFHPHALMTLIALLRAHGENLECLSLWSPTGRELISEEHFQLVTIDMLKSCPNLKFLELDIFAPHPLPLDMSPHRSIEHISLGLELLPTKEDRIEFDVSPMDQLVRSITKKSFPSLKSVHLLSADMSAVFDSAKGKTGWGMLPGWCRWAKSQGFDLKDGWGDVIREEDWAWLEVKAELDSSAESL